MIAKAEAKFLRISPSKVRQVIDLVRDKSAMEAEAILVNLSKRPKEYLAKILKSDFVHHFFHLQSHQQKLILHVLAKEKAVICANTQVG